MVRFLGIRREPLHSPNRESDDAKILQAVGEEMARHGAHARVVEVEEGLARLSRETPDLAAPMCEAYPVLLHLASLPGPLTLVNAPQGVLNCYRVRMVSFLRDCPEARFPRTEVRRIEEPPVPPAFMNGVGVWVKRGDVHNTCAHDVVRARDAGDLGPIRDEFRSRGIHHLVLQEHLDGDLIKFYGVGPGRWFTWFYHDPLSARNIPFEAEAMEEATSAAAAAVGLEVYGGDAIVSPQGSIHLIDINSWPSFARVRKEASVQIAAHLLARAKGNGPPRPGRRPAGAGAA